MKPSNKKNNFPIKDIPNFNDKTRSRIQLSDGLRDLEFKVANITNYFQNEKNFVEHLTKVSISFLSTIFFL